MRVGKWYGPVSSSHSCTNLTDIDMLLYSYLVWLDVEVALQSRRCVVWFSQWNGSDRGMSRDGRGDQAEAG
jgi:hypothetical protein